MGKMKDQMIQRIEINELEEVRMEKDDSVSVVSANNNSHKEGVTMGTMDDVMLAKEIERLSDELAMEDLKAWLENQSSDKAHFVRFDVTNERDQNSQVDSHDPESLMIAMEEAVDVAELQEAVVPVEEEDLLNDEKKRQKFNTFKERHIRRFHASMKEFKERVRVSSGETREKFVTVRNCHIVLTLEDGSENREWVESKRMSLEEFEWFMSKNMIHGYRGRGFVQGYSDLKELEIDMHDFTEQGTVLVGPKTYILPKTRELVVRTKRREVIDRQAEIHIGSGMWELINRGDYLDTMTSFMGQEEIMGYLMRNEIRYGLANELMTSEVEPDFQEVISHIEEEEYNYGYQFRDKNERKYWFNHYRDAISAVQSYKDLKGICGGIIFPIEDKKLPENHPLKKRWIRPLNILSKEDRQTLLALYRNKRDEMYAKSGNKLDQVLALLDDSTVTNIDQALGDILSPEEAGSVLSAASYHSKSTGEQLLSKQEWHRIKRIAEKAPLKKIDIKESVYKGLEKLSSIKLTSAYLKSEAIKKLVTGDEARELVDYGRQMLEVNNQKVFDYPTYQTLIELSKK